VQRANPEVRSNERGKNKTNRGKELLESEAPHQGEILGSHQDVRWVVSLKGPNKGNTEKKV